VRILLTTDVAGGVWTYGEELCAELAARGHGVHLVAFGGEPRADQREWLRRNASVGFTVLPHPLEWMPEPEPEIAGSVPALREIVDRFSPDVIHLNQFYPGGFDLGAPALVTAHSDVLSWWRSVRGEAPPADAWFERYRRWVAAGLRGARARVAPSRWLATEVQATYDCGPVLPIHNGRSAALFPAGPPQREPLVLTAGRLWDEGKGAIDLARAAAALPAAARAVVAGPARHPAGGADFPVDSPGLEWRGVLPADELRRLLRRVAVYAATSRYEPFGLAPLEAALSGCALVMTDLPPFRELWEGCARFYAPGDAAALADQVRFLLSEPHARAELADAARRRALDRYSTRRMADAYEQVYARLASGQPAPVTPDP
jgi:glycogen synthase